MSKKVDEKVVETTTVAEDGKKKKVKKPRKKSTFFADFKKFISKGSVVDMAVGVIIGSAFTAIVTSLTNGIIMPFINLLLSIGGDKGLEDAVTILKPGYTDGVLDLAKSIYINWGAFLTAVINFFLIAIVLFTLLRVMMKAQGMWTKEWKKRPTKEERATLREQGVDMHDRKAVLAATAELREKNKPVPPPPPETQEDILKDIRTLLAANVKQEETQEPVKAKASKK